MILIAPAILPAKILTKKMLYQWKIIAANNYKKIDIIPRNNAVTSNEDTIKMQGRNDQISNDRCEKNIANMMRLTMIAVIDFVGR